MKLDDLVEQLRESGTSEFKLALLRSIAAAHPGLALAGVAARFAAHHNVTAGTVRKVQEILARSIEVKPPGPAAPAKK